MESEQKLEQQTARLNDMRREQDTLREEIDSTKSQLTQREREIDSIRDREAEFENKYFCVHVYSFSYVHYV